MFKRIMSALLCALLLLCAFSCAPGKRKTFENDAKEYFDSFKEEQTAGKIQKTVKYDKKGSYAYSYPKTDDKEFNKQLLDYCEGLVEEFLKTEKTGDDRLFISYESYSPVKNVYSVQMHSKQTVGGKDTLSVKTFTLADEMSESLKTALAIEAREQNADIKKENLVSFLYKKDAVLLTYDVNGEYVTAQVPYAKVHIYLPAQFESADISRDERIVDINKKLVALTFDDGPHNTYSNKILDTLEKYDSVATFFEVGNLTMQGADTIKRAKGLGCEIASHTWSHANLQTSSLSEIERQIDKADETLEKVTGEKPSLLRPPYGAVGKTLLNNSDKYLIGWSVDTNDWKYRDKNKVVASVKNEDNLDGDVVLMHSLYDSTAKAVEEIVPWLIDNGYQLVTVSELVKYRYEGTLESGKYYSYGYFDYEK